MSKDAWYIEAYSQQGGLYCRDCVADTLEDDNFRDPYTTEEDNSFTPIFASDIDNLDEFECEYCFGPLG